MSTSHHYLARLAPIGRRVVGVSPSGEFDEVYSSWTFAAQRKSIGEVPVRRGHNATGRPAPRVGSVLRITTAAGWWAGVLELDDSAGVKIGQPVSLGFDLATHTPLPGGVARLDFAVLGEIALVERAAIDGAGIFARLEPGLPPAATRERVTAEPAWLRGAQLRAWERGGGLVRLSGRVDCIR